MGSKIIWLVLSILPVPYLIFLLDNKLYYLNIENGYFYSMALTLLWLPFVCTLVTGILSSGIKLKFVLPVQLLMAVLSCLAIHFFPFGGSTENFLYMDVQGVVLKTAAIYIIMQLIVRDVTRYFRKQKKKRRL
ncbi:hypothetical protein [Bacillus sp. 1P06AnD]|uniref:hypothetical protein n=1 Tax=Bacillus sp. 1P06AnD TaxID=3132208 RepID=UPI0039A2449A